MSYKDDKLVGWGPYLKWLVGIDKLAVPNASLVRLPAYKTDEEKPPIQFKKHESLLDTYEVFWHGEYMGMLCVDMKGRAEVVEAFVREFLQDDGCV